MLQGAAGQGAAIADALIALKHEAAATEAARPIAGGVPLEALRFSYRISGDTPVWRPRRAFDDGRQTFIECPADIGQDEAPPCPHRARRRSQASRRAPCLNLSPRPKPRGRGRPIPKLWCCGRDRGRLVRFRRGVIVGAALLGTTAVAGIAWRGLKPIHLGPGAAIEASADPQAYGPEDALGKAPKGYGDIPKLGPSLPGHGYFSRGGFILMPTRQG